MVLGLPALRSKAYAEDKARAVIGRAVMSTQQTHCLGCCAAQLEVVGTRARQLPPDGVFDSAP